MKRLGFIVMSMFLFFAFVAVAQDSPTAKLFDKYGGKDGYTTVSINKDLFSMFASIDSSDPDAQEVKDMMSQLDGIKVLMYEGSEEGDAEMSKFKEELAKINTAGYSELMVVKEKGEEVKFLAHKKDDKISELLLLINSGDEVGFISITGLIDMNTIAKLSKAMKIEGMENLQKLDEEK